MNYGYKKVIPLVPKTLLWPSFTVNVWHFALVCLSAGPRAPGDPASVHGEDCQGYSGSDRYRTGHGSHQARGPGNDAIQGLYPHIIKQTQQNFVDVFIILHTIIIHPKFIIV